MVSINGTQVMFQEKNGGFWPIVMDATQSKRIPLVLEASEIDIAVEMVGRIPEADYPFDYLAMAVAGAISIGMKYKGS